MDADQVEKTSLQEGASEQTANSADNEVLSSTLVGSDDNSNDGESVGDQSRVNESEEDEDDYDPEIALSVNEVQNVEPIPVVASAVSDTPTYASDSESSDDEGNIEKAKVQVSKSQVDGNPEDTEKSAVIVESSSKPASESDSECDSESESHSPSKVEADSNSDKSDSVSPVLEASRHPESGSESDEDYDPERTILPETVEEQVKPSVASDAAPQPEKEAPLQVSDLQEAYEAVMQSDIVKSEAFAQYTSEKQMEIIQTLLKEKQISLPSTKSAVPEPSVSNISPTNFTQSSHLNNRPDLSSPMTNEENEAYEKFLIAESQFLSSGEVLHEDSRVFVGNLPTNLVKKQDLFRLFSRYGELVEISLKTGYGFAQFRTVEACQACKKGEAGMPIYDRELRLDASHRRKNNYGDFDNNARGRERPLDSGFQEHDSKRFKPDVEDVIVIVTNEANAAYVNDVEQALSNHTLSKNSKDIGNADPGDEIRDAAYSGALGVCVIKDSKIDLQIFEETGDGGVKFDEYVDVDPPSACELLKTAKDTKLRKLAGTRNNGFSRRDDRAGNWKRANFHDASRGGVPQKPPTNFNYNDRNYGGRGYQQNGNGWEHQGGYSRPQKDWGHRPNYDISYGNTNDRRSGHFNQHSGYGSSSYNQAPGQPYNQGYGQNSYQNARPFQGTPNQGYQGSYQSGPAAAQAPQQPLTTADPALAQTLQNLDPNTMRSVVALLQQQGGAAAAPLGAPVPQHFPAYQNTHPQSGPSAQVNSLLAQLQTQPAYPSSQDISSYNQQPQPQPQQSHNGGPSQSSSKSLLDMLSRLDGQ